MNHDAPNLRVSTHRFNEIGYWVSRWLATIVSSRSTEYRGELHECEVQWAKLIMHKKCEFPLSSIHHASSNNRFSRMFERFHLTHIEYLGNWFACKITLLIALCDRAPQRKHDNSEHCCPSPLNIRALCAFRTWDRYCANVNHDAPNLRVSTHRFNQIGYRVSKWLATIVSSRSREYRGELHECEVQWAKLIMHKNVNFHCLLFIMRVQTMDSRGCLNDCIWLILNT